MLHGGDNDSTGAIAGAWYGALYGDDDANKLQYKVSKMLLERLIATRILFPNILLDAFIRYTIKY